MFKCSECSVTFTRKDNLKRHEKTSCKTRKSSAYSEPVNKKVKLTNSSSSSSNMVKCDTCKISIPRSFYTNHLKSQFHKDVAVDTKENGIKVIKSAFKNRLITFRLTVEKTYVDFDEFFNDIELNFIKTIKEEIIKHKLVKVNIEVFGLYILPTKDVYEIKSFNTRNEIVSQSTDIKELFDKFKVIIKGKAQDFEERDSGWTLCELLHLELNVNKFNPIRSSSYIPLPKNITTKKAVINIVNDDEYCFAWSIVSALFPATVNSNRVSSYPHFTTCLNLDDIQFPMKLEDIKKFEVNNNMSINVYGIERVVRGENSNYEIVGPLHYSKNKQLIHINLLLLSDNSGKTHYCWIKDMSRLLLSQINRNKSKKYFCDGCLQYFYSQGKLNVHQKEDCNFICTKIPTTNLKINKYGDIVPENILQFENFHKALKIPFVIYADFECALKKIDYVEPTDVNKPFTIDTVHHEPYAFVYFIKCSYNSNLSKLEYYIGENAAKTFCEKIELDVLQIYTDHLKQIIPMLPLTDEEVNAFNNATHCNICEHVFKPGEDKVHDHDHLTGKIRKGAAHSICNLNFKIPNFIPIFFHNLSGYDSHLFIKEMSCHGDQIDVLAQTKEKYISFSKNILVDTIFNSCTNAEDNIYFKIRFLDSFKFISEKLESLSNNLDADQCIEIKNFFTDQKKFNLIRKKGVFPYSYIDNIVKLNETKLPPKTDFFDNLTNEDISDSDYKRAKDTWELFNCKNLKDYATVYLISDCLILTDFFESFRCLCLDKYKLDPAQYYTAPSLSFDAMLKTTGVKLELLTDIDMIHFLRKSIRGGICHCSTRKAFANNTFFSDYDHTKPTSYIMYLDATNLYGYSMSQYLPISEFNWVSQTEIETLDIKNVSDYSDYGYILEVDMLYPKELHDKHNDMPFLAENIVPPDGKNKKLICNLNNKSKYVIHYRNLKQAMNNGLLLDKIYRVLKFKQSPWLKPYIDLNTKMRNNAKSKLEKNCFKLLINVIYGKCLENIDKRVDVKLVTHWENIGKSLGVQTLTAKPNYKNCAIFHENLVAIQMQRLNVLYNKPLYIGFAILEISKIVIYDFFYNYLKNKYANNVKLLYTDTDSLVIEVKTDNFYQDMSRNSDKFDLSNYELDNIHKIIPNTSIIGNMKDEYAGKVIKTFYGTGAKAYCIELGEKIDFFINYLKPMFQNNIQIIELTNEYLNVNINSQVLDNNFTILNNYIKNHPTKINVEIISNVGDSIRLKITDFNTKKAKGIKRSVIKQNISLDDYRKVIEKDLILYRRMNIFKSNLHNVYTQIKNKVALSPKDEKRFIMPGSSNTLAWGHYKIDENSDKNLSNLVDVLTYFNDESFDTVNEFTERIQQYNISEELLDDVYFNLLKTL